MKHQTDRPRSGRHALTIRRRRSSQRRPAGRTEAGRRTTGRYQDQVPDAWRFPVTGDGSTDAVRGGSELLIFVRPKASDSTVRSWRRNSFQVSSTAAKRSAIGRTTESGLGLNDDLQRNC
jgi:hypothetical protein